MSKDKEKKHLNVIEFPSVQRTPEQLDLFQDSQSLINDSTVGNIKGYAIVVFYEEGYKNARYMVPDNIDIDSFSYTVHKVLSSVMVDSEDVEEDEEQD